jgi:hypothetical protein
VTAKIRKIREDAITAAEVADMAQEHRDAAAMVLLVMDHEGTWFAQWSDIDVRDLCTGARRLQLDADAQLYLEDD